MSKVSISRLLVLAACLLFIGEENGWKLVQLFVCMMLPYVGLLMSAVCVRCELLYLLCSGQSAY